MPFTDRTSLSPAPASEPMPAPMPGPAGQLLIWSCRRLAACCSAAPLVGRAFRDGCGDGAAEALACFDTFLRALGHAGRRPLVIGPPGHAGLTVDERRLLALLAAAQHGEAAWLDAHLAWLARPGEREVLAIAAGALASALAESLPILDIPAPAPGSAAARPCLAWRREAEG